MTVQAHPKARGRQARTSPNVFPPQKSSSKQGIWSSQFLRDLSQIVRRTLRDTPVPLYTRISPWSSNISLNNNLEELVATRLLQGAQEKDFVILCRPRMRPVQIMFKLTVQKLDV